MKNDKFDLFCKICYNIIVMKIKLKEIREKKCISAYRIAKILNIDKSSVSQWERGLTCPSIENLIKLRKILNCSIDKILGLEE